LVITLVSPKGDLGLVHSSHALTKNFSLPDQIGAHVHGLGQTG